MFGGVKKVLGIEGVKIELLIPDSIESESGIVSGIVRMTSLTQKNIVESIHIKMIEKYERGRGKNKRINEYVMGQTIHKDRIYFAKDDIIEVPFVLKFVHVQSEMDKYEDVNFMVKGLVKFAKKLKGVQSAYSIHAEAKVKGTTLNPFDAKPIQLK
ncbi:MAG TPA: hypothetical protein PK611_06840 [Saprospiraceae bacterium]|nr:hypothetical protein [Saprospiraceae bacterium]HRO09492.1 hypothetical protein [Saprospiraceae bacterium]HRO73368.1 hypothetical protein [Saprospiraceae bacterium]HRP42770.1 hypothetical protein [Saprospiraceae bacterium]